MSPAGEIADRCTHTAELLNRLFWPVNGARQYLSLKFVAKCPVFRTWQRKFAGKCSLHKGRDSELSSKKIAMSVDNPKLAIPKDNANLRLKAAIQAEVLEPVQ